MEDKDRLSKELADLRKEVNTQGVRLTLAQAWLNLYTKGYDALLYYGVNFKDLKEYKDEFPEEDQYKLNQGNGQCRMTKVELLDAAGKRVDFLTADNPATLRVHVRAKKDLYDVELGLAFVTDGGVTIAGPNSRASGVLYNLPRGESFIEYSMPDVMLQAGRYWLTTCFVRDGEMFDFSDRQTELVVHADAISTQPGLVTFPEGSWSKRSGEPATQGSQK